MNPDWDGVMKSRAREPGPLRQSLMAPSQWDAVQNLRAERDALAARVRELETALIQQAKLTAYYNGKGNGLAYPSPNYPGKEVWWDYLTEEGRAALTPTRRDA